MIRAACLALLLLSGCETECLRGEETLWPPAPDEYRLLLTNRSSHMVELKVDGRSLGVFCDGVKGALIGNFERNPCSRIRAEFLDNPSSIDLDDCTELPESPCKENNTEGQVCYDTSYVQQVEAVLD